MWKLVIILLLLILVSLTWQLLNWAWMKPRKMERFLRNQGMKGNPYKFLFGDSKETIHMYDEAYSKPIGINDDVVPRLMPNILQTVQKHGNFSFTWAGPRPRIFIMDPGIARDDLIEHGGHLKTFNLSNKRIKMVASGIASMVGEEWTKSRSQLNPVFQVDKLKPMVPPIQSCCDDILNKWRDLASNYGGSCVVDVYPSLKIFTSTILAQLMCRSSDTLQIKRTFLQLAELEISAGIYSDISIPVEKYFPAKTNCRANAVLSNVRVSLTSSIMERLERRKAAADSYEDLLDIFMEELYNGKFTNDKDRQRIIEDAIDQCMTFFLAGFETSSNLLTWTLVLLSVHEDCQARAREEVFQVLGAKREIVSDGVAKLKYVTMIINETLRLYPPVMELSRLVDEDTKIKERTIPKGSQITFPILMYHRSPEIWGEDAGEFRPERFADGAVKAANGEAAFMPFGWGPRSWMGTNFGMLVYKILLAMLLREFSFEMSSSYTHAPVVSFTIRPQFGADLQLNKL